MTSTFGGLGVAQPLLRALDAEQHTVPTPIQAQAIPIVLEGRDLLGLAQTGTGKTAAFVLPILQRLDADRPEAPRGRHDRPPRALILAPTRELAIQIAERAGAYGRFTGLRHAVVYGGVSQRGQVAQIRRGVDILIATPGRLLDLLQQRLVRLDAVTTLVLDEADRMLDMGFIRDVKKIVGHLPAKRQSLLFSATMPKEIEALSASLLRDPARVDVTPGEVTIDRIDQRVYLVDAAAKPTLLARMLRDPAMTRVVVFTRTKRGADRVSERLVQAGIGADAIHGNKSQNARQRTLNGFRSGAVRVLVATDIAARGIDVGGISHVVNFELPHEPESYVHRIGRTARAGADGIALSLVAPAERPLLRDIERLTRKPIPVIANDSRAPETGDVAPAVTTKRFEQTRSDTSATRRRRRRPRRPSARHAA